MTFFRKALYRRPAAFFTLNFIAEFVWNNISFTARWVVSKSSQNMDLKLRCSTNNKRFFPLSLWFTLSLHEISASSAPDCLQKCCIAFEVVLCEQAVSNKSGVLIFTFLQLTGTTFSDTRSPYQLTIPVQIQRQTLTVSSFSRGVIFTRARVSLALLSLRENEELLEVYQTPHSWQFLSRA